MGLRQWIRGGEQYKVVKHDPPKIGSATGTVYPFTVKMRNPRAGLFAWFQIHYAVDFDMALRMIKDRERSLPALPFQRKSVDVYFAPRKKT